MDTNTGFVNRRHEDFTTWNLRYEYSDDIGELKETVLDLGAAIWSCLDGYVEPTKVQTSIYEFPTDKELSEFARNDSDDPDRLLPFPGDSETMYVEDDAGIQWADVAALVSDPNLVMPLYRMKSTRTKLVVKQGEVWVNDYTDEYETEDPHTEIWGPPLRVHLGSGNFDTEDYFTITIWSDTNIWFEDSEIGTANRQRLKRLISCLCEYRQPREMSVNGNFPFLHEPNREIPNHVAELHPDNLC